MTYLNTTIMCCSKALQEVFMSDEILWNKFAESGKIADYLNYSSAKEIKDDNSRGNRS